jgi:hypothetical protein
MPKKMIDDNFELNIKSFNDKDYAPTNKNALKVGDGFYEDMPEYSDEAINVLNEDLNSKLADLPLDDTVRDIPEPGYNSIGVEATNPGEENSLYRVINGFNNINVKKELEKNILSAMYGYISDASKKYNTKYFFDSNKTKVADNFDSVYEITNKSYDSLPNTDEDETSEAFNIFKCSVGTLNIERNKVFNTLERKINILLDDIGNDFIQEYKLPTNSELPNENSFSIKDVDVVDDIEIPTIPLKLSNEYNLKLTYKNAANSLLTTNEVYVKKGKGTVKVNYKILFENNVPIDICDPVPVIIDGEETYIPIESPVTKDGLAINVSFETSNTIIDGIIKYETKTRDGKNILVPINTQSEDLTTRYRFLYVLENDIFSHNQYDERLIYNNDLSEVYSISDINNSIDVDGVYAELEESDSVKLKFKHKFNYFSSEDLAVTIDIANNINIEPSDEWETFTFKHIVRGNEIASIEFKTQTITYHELIEGAYVKLLYIPETDTTSLILDYNNLLSTEGIYIELASDINDLNDLNNLNGIHETKKIANYSNITKSYKCVFDLTYNNVDRAKDYSYKLDADGIIYNNARDKVAIGIVENNIPDKELTELLIAKQKDNNNININDFLIDWKETANDDVDKDQYPYVDHEPLIYKIPKDGEETVPVSIFQIKGHVYDVELTNEETIFEINLVKKIKTDNSYRLENIKNSFLNIKTINPLIDSYADNIKSKIINNEKTYYSVKSSFTTPDSEELDWDGNGEGPTTEQYDVINKSSNKELKIFLVKNKIKYLDPEDLDITITPTDNTKKIEYVNVVYKLKQAEELFRRTPFSVPYSPKKYNYRFDKYLVDKITFDGSSYYSGYKEDDPARGLIYTENKSSELNDNWISREYDIDNNIITEIDKDEVYLNKNPETVDDVTVLDSNEVLAKVLSNEIIEIVSKHLEFGQVDINSKLIHYIINDLIKNDLNNYLEGLRLAILDQGKAISENRLINLNANEDIGELHRLNRLQESKIEILLDYINKITTKPSIGIGQVDLSEATDAAKFEEVNREYVSPTISYTQDVDGGLSKVSIDKQNTFTTIKGVVYSTRRVLPNSLKLFSINNLYDDINSTTPNIFYGIAEVIYYVGRDGLEPLPSYEKWIYKYLNGDVFLIRNINNSTYTDPVKDPSNFKSNIDKIQINLHEMIVYA